jgi:hypothetical protein
MNLGAITAKLIALLAAQDERLSDPMVGYGDCTGLVVKGNDRELFKFARQHGFDNPLELVSAIEQRTSFKWCHHMGLDRAAVGGERQ